jgi:acyl-CoA synthetase (AMP-forming)/AMP-acid ligase II
MLRPGLMMDRPLLISGIIEHAAAQFGAVEIVSRESHGPLHRYSYARCAARVRRLANALEALGLGAGSAVGTIACNTHRHLETYFAVSGSGMVLHTCNPRLHSAQLIYIVNHAEDRVMFFDRGFAPLIEELAPQCPQVRSWICLCEAADMPAISGVHHVSCYEDLIAGCPEPFDWPQFDERTAAALCYTSGTTGNPRGALYSHRSIILNALSCCLPGVFSLSASDTILGVVPMFHVNGWCIPYAAPIAGAKLVLPGQRLEGASLYELMETERVTVSAGVPTIWLSLIRHVEDNGLRFSTFKRVLVGGSAMPIALIAKYADEYGIEVRHGWGMTETVGVATMGALDGQQRHWPAARRHAVIAKQGKSLFGVETKVIDEYGAELPRDGRSQGELMVRGQWIIEQYYKGETSPLVDGWFATGDIATIDAQGTVQIRDRAKDLIKSGGEWISSIDLENAAIGHAAVAMAAVIGVRHPRWEERPLLFIVRKPQYTLEREEILAYLAQQVVKWWLPEEVIFLDSLPVGGTGKVQKALLRERYGRLFD